MARQERSDHRTMRAWTGAQIRLGWPPRETDMEFIFGVIFFVVIVGWLDATLPWQNGEKK